MQKDIGLALDSGRSAGATFPLGSAAHELCKFRKGEIPVGLYVE